MKLRVAAAALLFAASGASAGDALEHELLIFGSAEGAHVPESSLTTSDTRSETFAADILLSLQRGNASLLGEYLLTDHEGDLERFYLGWEPSSHFNLSVGRFHQPGSVWNSEHHHGQYLQTTITRPAAENWEDDGGIIPQHVTGALVESDWDLPADRVLKFAAGGGLIPVLEPGGLEPFDLVHPDAHQHRLGYQARIALQADPFGESGAGIVFAQEDIGVRGGPLPQLPSLKYVDFTLAGAYATWVHGDWKVSAVGYYVDAGLPGTTVRDSDFLTGYVLGEAPLYRNLRAFARWENTSHVRDSPYLEFFPAFVNRRTTLGVRWDFLRKQAITAEVAKARNEAERFNEYRVQWSAALL